MNIISYQLVECYTVFQNKISQLVITLIMSIEQFKHLYILDSQRKCQRQLANVDVGHRVEMEKCKPAIHGSCTLL